MENNGGDIENIFDIENIDAFISYKDYFELPQFKEYAKKNGVVLPDKITTGKEEKTEVTETETRKKVNAAAIMTCVFGLLFVAWAAIGCFLSESEKVGAFFVLYGGQNAVGIIKTLLGGGYGDALDAVAAVACLAAIVIEFVFGAIALTRLKKKGMGIAVTVGMLVAFALTLVSAVTGIVRNAGTPMGAAILVSALAFFTCVIAGVGDRKVKENV